MVAVKDVNDYLGRFDFDSLIAACTNDIATNPNDASDDYCRGYARCFVEDKDKKYLSAIEDLSRALALLRAPSMATAPAQNPLYHTSPTALTEDDCYTRRAYAYYLNANYQGAIDDCNTVIDHLKSSPDVNLTFVQELLGVICFNQKRCMEAIEHLRVAITHNPMSPELLDKYHEACKRQNS